MKKALLYTLVITMVLSLAVFPASAVSFLDLAEDHWAYENVQTLVTEGTVSGYEDGSFRPNGTVTRAEFVKMLGEGPTERSSAYTDVQATHWAYSYIMKSGLPEDGSNLFRPDEPLTRGLAAEMLWNRNGQRVDLFAPALITSQYKKNADAIAWAYVTGLMQGDDGVSLRTEGTLSRAEAAALIIRARQTEPEERTFAEIASPKIMENVFTGLHLFDDMAYEPEKTITNGELARAALRYAAEEHTLTYTGYNTDAGFEHPYSKDMAVIFKTSLGKKEITAALADKTATFGDAVAALSYACIAKSHKGLSYQAQTEGLPAGTTAMMNACLTFARDNGIISLDEPLEAPITLQEFTAICLLLDQLSGSQSDISTKAHPILDEFMETDHSLLLTEVPYGDFRVMLANMPYEIYSTPYLDAKSAPIESYDFAREYETIFIGILEFLEHSVEQKSGADVEFIYYPSLVAANSNGYTLRVACDIVSLEGTKSFSDMFPVKEGWTDGGVMLKAGSRIYLDLATGQSFNSIVITDQNAYVEQIICRN
ncbi:MAG: S-layer homology domain-containing protein [Ruminococcaceae bacterium]|nr:S-layer homology domain-containing protein [Oscillospiraceae bacterium]